MWLKFAFGGTVLTLLSHLVVLIVNGQDPITTPVSQLSRHHLAGVQTTGLVVFGCAHVALAVALKGLDHGRFWPYARALLVASGIGLIYVAWYFATAAEQTLSGVDANDPLWVVASLTGMAMGALQPGLSRLAQKLGLFSTLCLGAWIWLVPVVMLVDESWLGAYERMVGSVYIVWMLGVSLGLLRLAEDRPR